MTAEKTGRNTGTGKPKVVIIGAGSYFFGRAVIKAMATSPVLCKGTLALVDTDPEVLETMMKLAERVFAEAGSGTGLEGSTDRREVLPGADFTVLSFSNRNTHFRGLDTEIAARHGIRMCSSDTIGPGGIFRALREIPHALEMARDTAELAPHSWTINFVNPTAVLGIALGRFAPEARSFAICDGLHEPHVSLNYLKRVGLLPEDADSVPPEMAARLEIAIAGVNHCTWLTRFRYDGKDMMPAWWKTVEERAREEKPNEKAKPRFNQNYALQLMDLYGAWPIAVSHTKEYVPFFQGYGSAPVKPEPIRCFDAENRAREMRERWQETEAYSRGEIPVGRFLAEIPNDHATDIIESMWGGLNRPFYVNTFNRGAVTNMPDDAYLELRCNLDLSSGPRPMHFGEMPRGLLALQHQVLDTHELTAEAAVTGDRSILRRALLTDPIVNNIGDADACMEDFLSSQEEALPDYWYR